MCGFAAASGPVFEIADRIASLPASGSLQNAVKEMAAAQQEGRYWQRFGRQA